MSKNQNIEVLARSPSQKNALSDDLGDGACNSFTAEDGEGDGPPGEKPDEQNADLLEELGKGGAHR